jgi:hypothetical protein
MEYEIWGHGQMLRALVLALLLLALSFGMAHADGGRVALVVGVSQYEHAGSLPNTLNDAKDMSAALKRLGFDVETMLDPSRSSLEAAVRRYGDRSTGAEVSVFYYSGHALEVGGHNWLLPATTNIRSQRDLRFEAVDLQAILEQTDGAAKVAIVFLDACRANPFAGRITASGRSLAHGLARVEMTASGVLLAFSTAPGQIAVDGVSAQKNSPFTAALLRHLETAGLEVKSLVARVTKDVVAATKGKQRPWQNSSLEGDFYFVPPPASEAAPVAPPAANIEVIFWDSIKASRNPADFVAYLAQFPKGVFVGLARNRLVMLQQQGTATQPQTANPTAQPPESKSSPAAQPEPPAPPPGPGVASSSPHDVLLARLASYSVAADERESRVRSYESEAAHKAMAVSIDAHHTYRTAGWSTAAAAEMGTLEACQIYYGKPCTLVAVDDKVEPAHDGRPVLRDMARARYADAFDPDQIPNAQPGLRRRVDVAAYRSAPRPKAAAYHPWGWLFTASGAAGQFEAEEQVLAQCNNDPDRKSRDGPCFLYAVSNLVVLPQRLVKPRPRPQTISEAFAYMGVKQTKDYAEAKAHKAIAIALQSARTFRWGNASTVAQAEERALEGCQLTNQTPCILLASDDALHATDPWKAPRHDMPRLHYDGAYAPDRVPLFASSQSELQSYMSLPAPKAMVIRPSAARVKIATGTTLEQAQTAALAACNDPDPILPCFIYAINDRVIIGQRRTEPLK